MQENKASRKDLGIASGLHDGSCSSDIHRHNDPLPSPRLNCLLIGWLGVKASSGCNFVGIKRALFDAEKPDRRTFSMGTLLINFLLGACRHRHQSRPFTLDKQTYMVCLDCGKEIGHSLERMASR
jgi:hypothetical protein